MHLNCEGVLKQNVTTQVFLHTAAILHNIYLLGYNKKLAISMKSCVCDLTL